MHILIKSFIFLYFLVTQLRIQLIDLFKQGSYSRLFGPLFNSDPDSNFLEHW